MGAYVSHQYVVTSPVNVRRRPFPKQEKRAVYTIYSGRQLVDLDHVFNSILVSDNQYPIPAHYLKISVGNMPSVDMRGGGVIRSKKLGVYAVLDHSLMAAYEEQFNGASLKALRVQRVVDGTYVLTVKGDLSDYVVGVLSAEDAKGFFTRIDGAIEKMVANHPLIIKPSNKIASLWQENPVTV